MDNNDKNPDPNNIPLFRLFVFFLVTAVLSSLVSGTIAIFGVISKIAIGATVVTAIAGVFKWLFANK